jgi:hypothetical protein
MQEAGEWASGSALNESINWKLSMLYAGAYVI